MHKFKIFWGGRTDRILQWVEGCICEKTKKKNVKETFIFLIRTRRGIDTIYQIRKIGKDSVVCLVVGV